jgi:hypothetical protein
MFQLCIRVDTNASRYDVRDMISEEEYYQGGRDGTIYVLPFFLGISELSANKSALSRETLKTNDVKYHMCNIYPTRCVT